MSRRVPNATVREIGAERIDGLLRMSEDSLRNGREDRARRYVDIARGISGKTRVKMPKDRRYCKGCHAPLVPGMSCTVRLSKHKVCIRCDLCGEVKRIPYLREQRT
jgi:ribonuclease P protein subunit RPR2